MKWINDVVFAILAAHGLGQPDAICLAAGSKTTREQRIYAAIILSAACRNCGISFASGTRSSIDC